MQRGLLDTVPVLGRRVIIRSVALALAAVLLGVFAYVGWAPTADLIVPTGRPLALTAPPGWSAADGLEPGRYEVYWEAAENKPMDPEALSRTKQYRVYSVWKDIPSDRILVRVQTAFTPATGESKMPQAAFPLDWSRAERQPDDWGFEVWVLRFSVDQVPYAAVAHIGTDASPFDRAAVRAVIASVRPR